MTTLSASPAPPPESKARPRVFMMDLWATVPYYTAYLCRALLSLGIPVQLGSIDYYLDPEVFRSRGLQPDPGLSNIVGRHQIPRPARRVFKLLEGLLNLAALSIRFLFRPPDILHVQFLPLARTRFPIDVWFVRLCRLRGSKFVLTVHDLLPHDTSDRYRHIFASLYRSADALICHSDHVRQMLETQFLIPPARIAVIPHGPFFYDVSGADHQATLQPLGVDANQKMVLWQGIIFPYKGVDLLLDAWKHVEQSRDDLTLVILGTGAPKLLDELQERARNAGLTRVRFNLRFCSASELVSAYRAATVVVYPYRAITTSGALATGLALGRPIIASSLPVFRELLTHESNALLVDPADPSDLSRAICRITEDPELCARLSAAVQAMRFGDESWSNIAAQTAALYRSLLHNAGRTSLP